MELSVYDGNFWRGGNPPDPPFIKSSFLANFPRIFSYTLNFVNNEQKTLAPAMDKSYKIISNHL